MQLYSNNHESVTKAPRAYTIPTIHQIGQYIPNSMLLLRSVEGLKFQWNEVQQWNFSLDMRQKLCFLSHYYQSS